jgi:hypothetical protein
VWMWRERMQHSRTVSAVSHQGALHTPPLGCQSMYTTMTPMISKTQWPEYEWETEEEANRYDTLFRRFSDLLEPHLSLLSQFGWNNVYKKCVKWRRGEGSGGRRYYGHERHFAFFLLFTRLSGHLHSILRLDPLPTSPWVPTGIHIMTWAALEQLREQLNALATDYCLHGPSSPSSLHRS